MSRTLAEAREAVLLDVGSIPEVTFEFFSRSVLPTPVATSNVDIADVKATLISDGALTGGRWNVFPIDPAKQEGHGDVVFSLLVHVNDSIVKAAKLDQPTTCIFVQRPHKSPTSTRANKTRPDGCRLYSKHNSEIRTSSSTTHPNERLSPCEHEEPMPRQEGEPVSILDQEPVRWEDVIEAEEYKKKKSYDDVRDNREKLIWGMHHIMRADPRRRFTFGAHGMVTHAFNFVTEHEKLIQLVLSLSFATDEELGYDRTMRAIEAANGTRQYEIDIGRLTFVSSRILSDLAAGRLCGRATRVFEVTEKSGPLQNFALKDQWFDDDRQAEGRVLEDLRALIKSEKEKGRFDDMHLPKDPTNYFLSVKAHGSVQVNATSDDNTSTTIMRGCSLPEGCPVLSLPFSEKKVVASEVSGIITDSTGHIPYPGVSIAPLPPLKHPRRHERTVFNEVGTPLHDLDKFADFFRGLADATIALEIIHRLKRVHRDVSTGNILLYQGGGRLSDLEFLKELSSLQTREVKTGTRQFTAVEIEREKGIARESTTPPSVLFNPLHDHESIWWIACWALLHYIPADHIPNNDEELREQVDYARRLFHPTIFAPERIEVLRHGLPPELAKNIPKRFGILASVVSAIGDSFVYRYTLAEANPTRVEEQAFDGFWQDLHKAYEMLVEHFRGVKVKILDLRVEKRKFEEATNDDWVESDGSPVKRGRHLDEDSKV